jgi:hypothetical protein
MTQEVGELFASGGQIFQLRHLERLQLGLPYPAIVAHVGRLLTKVPNAELAIDMSGVGRPVFDLFQYGGIYPIGVTITAGTAVKREGRIASVPKLHLVSRLQVLLHQGRLKIHKEIPDAPALVRELQDFRVTYSEAGNIGFSARSGKHDDMVLALAIAVFVLDGGGMDWRAGWELYERESCRLQGIEVPDRQTIGVDLGQSRDPTAIAVVRRIELPTGRKQEER